jgi:aspartate/methionine/tyrosine aminotransferase
MNNEHKETPIPYKIVNRVINESGISKVGKASIREIVRLINIIEEESGQKFIRMEMGVPGFPPSQIGVDAEIEALKNGVAGVYPEIEGIPELKNEASRFVKLFLNLDVEPESIIPTVGSMQGSFVGFMVSCRRDSNKDTTLFLDPCFPLHKQQQNILGLKYEAFDVYNYRGEKLRDKLESYLHKKNISTIIYSNPNNPSWMCFTNDELKIIGELATKYGVIVIEDLAYFAMDFRQDYSIPGNPPYQPTVANFTDNYILLISSSKVFSYAGQRIGIMVINNKLFHHSFPNLLKYFPGEKFGTAIIHGAIYAVTAGVSHSTQKGLTAMFKAVNDNRYNLIAGVREYGERAKIMKALLLENGFKIVYEFDLDKKIADGFYFTFCYPDMTAEELIEELLYYGISAISLDITGSERSDGLRACVSHVGLDQMKDFEMRLKAFNRNKANRVK